MKLCHYSIRRVRSVWREKKLKSQFVSHTFCFLFLWLAILFSDSAFLPFLFVQNSSVGDLVGHSHFWFWNIRHALVVGEQPRDFDLSDIWSEWRGDMNWQTKRIWQIQDHLENTPRFCFEFCGWPPPWKICPFLFVFATHNKHSPCLCFCFVFLWLAIPIKDSLSIASKWKCGQCSSAFLAVQCTEMLHIFVALQCIV